MVTFLFFVELGRCVAARDALGRAILKRVTVSKRAVNRVLGGGGESAQAQFFVFWCG